MHNLILKLQSIGVIKFGNFEIKKDFISPFQVDFSGIVSHPEIAKALCNCLWEKAQNLNFDLLFGVPTTAACLANYLAWEHDRPLVLKRPNAAEMETKIEGSFKSGQSCLVIQDVILSGQPTLEVIDDLEEEGIKVRDVLGFFDLELGGREKIKTRGYVLHCLLSISEAIQILYDAGKLGGDHFKLATDFLEND
ncbi:MAG: Orotate phosphoribosyltransferase [Chlamydiae bacterium]|nr:Orotate phosphoribosyltransferase [Chlamydiota bacterium]